MAEEKTKFFRARLPARLHAQLKARALRNKRFINSELILALEREFARNAPEEAK
jgi:hypothetical protein